MIISHKHKFVFLHNPKVAGSAIHQALAPFHDHDINFWHQRYFPSLDRVVDAAHLTAHDLFLVCPELKRQGYTYFTVVRNPYQRFVSSLAEHVRQHGIGFDYVEDWVLRHMDETNFRFNWKYIHFCPQHYFVPWTEWNTVLHHEKLNEEWPELMTNLGIRAELPRIRVRPDVDPLAVTELTPYVVQQINRVYHQDFRQFGFERQLETGAATSHYERVNGIHSPYQLVPELNTLTEGELKAYQQHHGV